MSIKPVQPEYFTTKGHAPVFGTSSADLDSRRLVDYFARVREQEYLLDEVGECGNEAAWESLLMNTGILHQGYGSQKNQSQASTVASLMLFGKNPGEFLPQARIEATAYLGTEREASVKERNSLHGPIVPLHGGDGSVLEPGLIGQAMAFIRRNMGMRQVEHGLARETWDYPPEAVREVVVNAIIHRDYAADAVIEISIYANLLEVASPGPLPDGMTPEKVRAGARRIRNEFLKDVMRDYGFPAKARMGVHQVAEGMKEHNGTEPEFIEDGERFIVRLWKGPRE